MTDEERVARALDIMEAEIAVVEAAKAMRDVAEDSVKALYAAVDALRELEKQT